jgi:hypothetical protein
MVFNAPLYRDYLHTLKSYVVSAFFLVSSGWGQDGSANILVEKESAQVAVVIVVGKIIHDRLYCGPTGNYTSNSKFGTLKTAKYQLTIGRPDQEVFANEFDTAFKTLQKVQSGIASTQDRQHFLIGENDKVNNIRFTAPVFDERLTVRFTYCIVRLIVR